MFNEKGISTTEFAIVLPFVLLMFTGMVDISNLIQNHMVLTQVAREGARALSAVPELAQNEFTDLPADAPHSGHLSAQQRIDLLLDLYKLDLDKDSISITTAFAPLPMEATPTAADDLVIVEISATFDGMLPGFRGFEFKISEHTGYLYDQDATASESVPGD